MSNPDATSAQRDLNKAAARGEPSYVWRAGQIRRMSMILEAAEGRVHKRILENGCGVGMYVEQLAKHGGKVTGLEYDFERAFEAVQRSQSIINAAGETLPFPANHFDLILSHEVLEHVQNDLLALSEMVRVLCPGGRILLFVPNRGYPFETHGIYLRGRYRFGNIPLINYLPLRWRNHLAPHVRVYTHRDLSILLNGLPVKVVDSKIIFGAYDNLIARFGLLGKILRWALQTLEQTPLQIFGLSHFWVIEKL